MSLQKPTFPSFYRNWRIITVVTTVWHQLLRCVWQIQLSRSILFFQNILYVSTYVPLGLPSGLRPSHFPISLPPHMCFIPFHYIFDLVTLITCDDEFHIMTLHIMQVSTVSCYILLVRMCSSIPYSRTPLVHILSKWGTKFHTHTKTDRIRISHILTCRIILRKLR